MKESDAGDGARLKSLEGTLWDAVVVGAGPAGAAAAAMLAEKGGRVLLVEKARWPREKVCGGCLNAQAVKVLKDAGLVAALQGGQKVDRALWRVGKQRLELSAPGGMAISRSELDAQIVAEARARGTEFLPGIAARLLPEFYEEYRAVELRTGNLKATVRAAVVLACDGIGGTLLNDEPWAQWRIVPHGWIGLAATCDAAALTINSGTIAMHIGPGGYVGAVRLADGRVHLAAAVDAQECRRAGGPAAITARILAGCGVETNNALSDLRFAGTGTMTRRRAQLAGHRVMAIGDACGYVEPFTGEGMGWALLGAREAVSLLPRPAQLWPANFAQLWSQRHWQVIGRSQRWCKALRAMMHQPTLAAAGVALGRLIPAAGRWVAAGVCRPQSLETGQGVVG